MNICLVEIKNEYTLHLIKILVPIIFEGLQSVYNTSIELSTNNILKDFQILLESIPSWNKQTIDNETSRIINNSPSYLQDLIKATIKSNIDILNCNNSTDLYKNININNFIHSIYIECAREIYNNPYIFYHKLKSIEIKKNQRDIMQIIGECIKDAIRKEIPIEKLLKSYLNIQDKNIQAKNNSKEIIKYDFNQPIHSIESSSVSASSSASSSTEDNLLEKIEQKLHTDNKTSIVSVENNLDSKLKSVLNRLGDTENDTSLNYTSDYQEIYNNNPIH